MDNERLLLLVRFISFYLAACWAAWLLTKPESPRQISPIKHVSAGGEHFWVDTTHLGTDFDRLDYQLPDESWLRLEKRSDGDFNLSRL